MQEHGATVRRRYAQRSTHTDVKSLQLIVVFFFNYKGLFSPVPSVLGLGFFYMHRCMQNLLCTCKIIQNCCLCMQILELEF